MVSLSTHKSVNLTEVNPEFAELPQIDSSDDPFNYMLEVYMDNYIVLDIPSIQAQLHHVTNYVTTGIHGVLPTYKDNEEDATPLRIFLKKEYY